MKIALVNMPFSSIVRPSIGISLLKSAIEKHGFNCDNYYFNLKFPLYIGLENYITISDAPPTALVGEWIFSDAAFGYKIDDGYLNEIDDKFARRRKGSLTPELLMSIREKVEPFLYDCLETVDWNSYDIIGFTSVFEQNVASLAMARRIKERWPNKLIVFGGANCEGPMGKSLIDSFSFVDVVCQGEGDLSFPKYVLRLYAGESVDDIPGILTRNNYKKSNIPSQTIMDLDQLTYPDYDDYFKQFDEFGYKGFLQPSILFESSRGCWWGEKNHCTFCGLNGSNIKFRSKTQKRSLEELIALQKRYIQFTDQFAAVDNILDYKYFEEFLPNLKELGLGIDLFYETKANLKRDQVKLLSSAGFTAIQPGIESLITDVLKRMRKGVTMLQNIRLLKLCLEYGLIPNWNIIYGFSGEREEDYKKAASLIPMLHHLTPPDGCSSFRLDRFSPFFNQPDQFGITNIRPYNTYKYVYTTLEESILFNLAYYFEFDYVNEQNSESYTTDMRAAVDLWHKSCRSSQFYYIIGQHGLHFHDSRDGEVRRFNLTGWDAKIYRACEDITTPTKVQKTLADQGILVEIHKLKTLMDNMVDCGMMLSEDNYYLSLAIEKETKMSSSLEKFEERVSL
jgi:ribosomal peptide maturation radical SAM protein 1